MTFTNIFFLVCALALFAIVAAVVVANNKGYGIPYKAIEFWLMVVLWSTVLSPFLLFLVVGRYVSIDQMAEAVGRQTSEQEDEMPAFTAEQVGDRQNVYNW